MRAALPVAAVLLACNPEQAPDREEVERVVKRAEKGLRSGYAKAKARLQEVDWQEAYEQTAKKVEEARDHLDKATPREPEPERWWDRADEAVKCDADACVIEGWFSRAAAGHPGRLRGDVKVFTAPEEDGWMIDNIRRGSLADVLGFENGDVIQTVAGQALTDKWARVAALQALQGNKSVMIAYRRGREVRTLRLVFHER